MLIYRRSGIPSFLTRLPLIHRWRCLMAPVEEDVAVLKEYADGGRDIEESSSPYSFKVAIDQPDLDEIEAKVRGGKYKSSATIAFDAFGWDAVDVARVLRYDRDEDEITRKLRDEDFDRDFVELACYPVLGVAHIRNLAAPTSVLPFIDDWERFDSLSQSSDPLLRRSQARVDAAWHLDRRERESIQTEEGMLFELHRAEQRQRKLRRVNNAAANTGLVTPGLREKTLRSDSYVCFFTGAAPPTSK